MGELDSSHGFVPSNLVEEVTDPEELADIRTLLLEGGSLRRGDADLQRRNMNGRQGLTTERIGEGVAYKMKILYDYDPIQDSPNNDSGTELVLTEGEVITVFGWADSDGFIKVCLCVAILVFFSLLH